MYTTKFFSSMLLLICFSACATHNNPETKIQEYIQKNIDHPSSYTPISFGKLETDSTQAVTDPQYVTLTDSIKKYKQLTATEKTNTAQFPFHPATQMSSLDKIFQAENQQYAIINNFKSRPCGFVMKHVFKKQNASGNIISDSMNFHFDSGMNLRENEYYKNELNKN